MKETTRALLMLGGFALIVLIGWKFLPSKTSLDTAQSNFKKTAQEVKFYVDNKVRLAVEETKKTSSIQDVQLLQDQVAKLVEKVEFLEKNDLTKEVLELQEQVANLVTENGQLKIYITNLERMAHNASVADKGVAELLQVHFAEYEKYKLGTDILLKTLGTDIIILDKRVDELDVKVKDLELKEHRVLTKQTIVKTYYCYPRRCCR